MTTPPPLRLSVVIAAYAAAETLPEQLSALIAQRPTFGWEIIVADNGSTDGTRELVAEWAREHHDIRLVDASRRRGPAAARNIGVAAARGEWIAFCDADDIVGDGWVAAVADALSKSRFVAGRFARDRLRTGAFTVSWSPQLDSLSAVGFLPGFLTAGAGNMAMHRTVFTAIDGFDESALAAEDDDFCLRAQLAGFALTYEPCMLLHVRQRTGLRAVVRQARAYGVGARRLRHRYAGVIAEAAQSGIPLAPPPPGRPPAPEAAVVEASPPRTTVPSRIANALWRIGWSWGWRRARLDDVDQIALRGIHR